MNFVPNVTRQLNPIQWWSRGIYQIHFSDYYSVSAAAYLRSCAQNNAVVFDNSHCDMLFIMEPHANGWDIEIITQTNEAAILKEFLLSKIPQNTAACITLH